MDKKETLHEKNELLKKVGKYSVAAGAALLTGNIANAAVNVTTVNLNLQGGDEHYIDFDGDGKFEFLLTVWQSSTESSSAGASLHPAWHFATSLRDPDAQYAEVIQGGPFAYDYWDPAALPQNRIIGPTLQSGSSFWSAYSWAATIISTSSSGTEGDGNFDLYPGQTRYIGVRFSSDGSTWHYGWIAIQCNSLPLYNKPSIGTMIAYAYETQDNTPIYAGNAETVPLLPIASAAGLGLVGLFGALRARRKKQTV